MEPDDKGVAGKGVSRKQGPQVLIVDDDPPIRNLLRQILRRLGIDSREARDGIEALEVLDELEPDLLLLDLMMPRMNGWEVLRRLRDSEQLERIPVVVITAIGPHRIEELSEFPVRAVLSKPFEVHDLIETVKTILERQP